MDNPLISIIIPSYNYAQYLHESIGSVIAQTYAKWECIVVDDGSTDNSRGLVELLAANDSRIKYLHQAKAGPTIARNNGVQVAKGEFIQFLDADDLLEKQKLEKHISLFNQNPEFDIVYSGVKYFDSNNPTKLFDNINLKSGRWMKNLSGVGDVMISELLKGNIMVISSPLVRKQLFEKLGAMNELLQYNEDWEMWARFAIGGANFHFANSDNTQALVRVHESYSKDNFKMFSHGLKVCLMLNKRVDGRKFRKIMTPKINYHKRIIDEKLLEILASDKAKAISTALEVYGLTGVKRYLSYSRLFSNYPSWYCYLYARTLFIIHKLKNVILYA